MALGLAVQLVNATALAELEAASRRIAGNADLILRGTRAGFSESVYADVASRPEVEVASPVVEVLAKIIGRNASLKVLGVDLFRAAELQPGLVAEIREPLDALAGDAIFLSAAAQALLGVRVGDPVRLQAGLEPVELRFAGMLSNAQSGTVLGVMDIGAVQAHFGRAGRLTRIDLRLVPGTDPERFAAALPVPAGASLERPDAADALTARMTRAYRVNLIVLALVALFTGAMLVASTQALSVVRRRPQIGLLRVLGLTRGGIARLVLAESAALGVVGAALGTAGGIGLAWAILLFVGTDLGAGWLVGSAPRLVVTPGPVLVFGLLGIAAAVLGGLAPALEAARAEPSAALRSGDDARAFAPLVAAWPGALLLVAGLACLPFRPVAGLPLFGYLSIALLLLGTLMLMPRLTAWIAKSLPRTSVPEAYLARCRLAAYPVHAAASLAAIVAAVGLSVAMAVMVTSFRVSLGDWLEGILPADLYLRAGGEGDSGFVPADVQARMAVLPGVRRIEFLRWQSVILSPAQPPVILLARDDAEDNAATRLPWVSKRVATATGLPPAWISEAAAALHGLAPGDRIALPLGGRAVPFHVEGVWRDYARPSGAVLIDRQRYVEATGDRVANDAGVWFSAPSEAGSVRAGLSALAPDGLELWSPGDIRVESLAIFDRTFAVTYALEAIAVLIGLLGLSSAIGADAAARRHEFGMLRHLGISRRQIVRMLALEGVGMTGAGLLAGAVVGAAISLVLIHVVNRQSFHWGMSLHVPWGPLALFFGTMLAAGAATAVVSGRQATSDDAVRSVREDW